MMKWRFLPEARPADCPPPAPPNLAKAVSFFKMEGLGNDYVFIDMAQFGASAGPNRKQKHGIEVDKKHMRQAESYFSASLIRQVSDRHRGIGSDGLVLLYPVQSQEGEAHHAMRMWNADGSPSPMCGNALRCIALWEYYQSSLGQLRKDFLIESQCGLHQAQVSFPNDRAWIQVQMTSPFFEADSIPLALDKTQAWKRIGPLLEAQVSVKDYGLQRIYALSMGNPHCLLFTEELTTAPLEVLGPSLGTHPAFPEGSNVSFVCQKKEGLFVRTYERGSGETQACGSAACAAQVAAVLKNKAPAKQKVFLPGGHLEIEWKSNAAQTEKPPPVLMCGSATWLYSGRFFCS